MILTVKWCLLYLLYLSLRQVVHPIDKYYINDALSCISCNCCLNFPTGQIYNTTTTTTNEINQFSRLILGQAPGVYDQKICGKRMFPDFVSLLCVQNDTYFASTYLTNILPTFLCISSAHVYSICDKKNRRGRMYRLSMHNGIWSESTKNARTIFHAGLKGLFYFCSGVIFKLLMSLI